MLNIKQSKKLVRKFVNKVLPAVSVNLLQDAEFTKPFVENGLCHSFCLLVLNGHNERVLHAPVGDAQDVLVLMASRQHWSKEICVNPNIRMVWVWKRWQQTWFVCRLLLCWHTRQVLV